MGASFALSLQQLGAGEDLPIAAFGVVGMGSMLSATTRSPLLAMIMVFEISLDYSLMPALMLACVMSMLVARRLHPETIYTEPLRRKGLIVPQEATAGALMVVGLLMLAAVGNQIPWKEFTVGLPAVFALMVMPLTWSITNGVGAGVILYALLNPKRAGALVWIVAVIFAIYFALGVH